MKKYYAGFLPCLILAVAMFQRASALEVPLTQTIRPIDCIITQVNSGQQVQVTASVNCGIVIFPRTNALPVPSARFAPSPSPSGTTGPTPSSGGSLQPMEYLNDMPNLFTTRGLAVIIKPNDAYTFRLPSDSGLAKPRIIQFTAVGQHGVAVTIDPRGVNLLLKIGEKKWLDLNGDGRRDLLVQVLSVSPEGIAAVRISLDDTYLYMHDAVIPKQDQLVAVIVMGSLSVFSFLGLHFYHRKRAPKLPKGWHNHFVGHV